MDWVDNSHWCDDLLLSGGYRRVQDCCTAAFSATTSSAYSSGTTEIDSFFSLVVAAVAPTLQLNKPD